MKTSQPERWIILPDVHLPREDKAALAAVEAYMADHRWDGWVQLGDLIDFDELSRWQDGNRRLDKTGAIEKSYSATRAFLDRHAAILRRKNPSCKMVLIEGNHEDRINKYLEKHPEGVGMLEVPVALGLKARTIQWVPFWTKGKMFKLGKCYIAHGRYTGGNHAKKHVEAYGVNTLYGHLHSIQSYSKRTLGNSETKEAACIGCLCRYDMDYLRGGPTDWQQGFCVVHVLPNGFFHRFQVRIFNGRFISPEGKEYGG